MKCSRCNKKMARCINMYRNKEEILYLCDFCNNSVVNFIKKYPYREVKMNGNK